MYLLDLEWFPSVGIASHPGVEWTTCRNTGATPSPTLWLSRCQSTAEQAWALSLWCPAPELCEQGRRKEDGNRQSQPLVREKYHKGYVRQSINKAIMLFFGILGSLCLSAFYNLSFCVYSHPTWIFVFAYSVFFWQVSPYLKKKKNTLGFLKPRSSLHLPFQFSSICFILTSPLVSNA